MSTLEEIERYNQHIAALERAVDPREQACLTTIESINALDSEAICLRARLRSLDQAQESLHATLIKQLTNFARKTEPSTLHASLLCHWAMQLREALPMDVYIAIVSDAYEKKEA